MVVSKALGWLCEEPEHSFTLNKIFRRGWPGLADLSLLPKQLELGRAVRTLERCLFLGGLAAFAVVGGRPALSWGLVVELKAIALIVGFVTQGTLKAAEYLISQSMTTVVKEAIERALAEDSVRETAASRLIGGCRMRLTEGSGARSRGPATSSMTR